MRKLVGLALAVASVVTLGAFETRAGDMTVKEWLSLCGHKIADNPNTDIIAHIQKFIEGGGDIAEWGCMLNTEGFLNGVAYTLVIEYSDQKGSSAFCIDETSKGIGRKLLPVARPSGREERDHLDENLVPR